MSSPNLVTRKGPAASGVRVPSKNEGEKIEDALVKLRGLLKDLNETSWKYNDKNYS